MRTLRNLFSRKAVSTDRRDRLGRAVRASSPVRASSAALFETMEDRRLMSVNSVSFAAPLSKTEGEALGGFFVAVGTDDPVNEVEVDYDINWGDGTTWVDTVELVDGVGSVRGFHVPGGKKYIQDSMTMLGASTYTITVNVKNKGALAYVMNDQDTIAITDAPATNVTVPYTPKHHIKLTPFKAQFKDLSPTERAFFKLTWTRTNGPFNPNHISQGFGTATISGNNTVVEVITGTSATDIIQGSGNEWQYYIEENLQLPHGDWEYKVQPYYWNAPTDTDPLLIIPGPQSTGSFHVDYNATAEVANNYDTDEDGDVDPTVTFSWDGVAAVSQVQNATIELFMSAMDYDAYDPSWGTVHAAPVDPYDLGEGYVLTFTTDSNGQATLHLWDAQQNMNGATYHSFQWRLANAQDNGWFEISLWGV